MSWNGFPVHLRRVFPGRHLLTMSIFVRMQLPERLWNRGSETLNFPAAVMTKPARQDQAGYAKAN